VQGDVICLVALDLVLRVFLTRMMHVSFVVHVLRMHLHDLTADVSSLGVPDHVVANLELLLHDTAFTSLIEPHIYA